MISVVLIIIVGIMNAIMDVLTTRWETSIFKRIKNDKLLNFVDPLSWENKWKNGDKSQGEKFLGSSTFLVFLTDLWHLSKTLMIVLGTLAAITYEPMFNAWIDAIILYASFTVTFQLFYEYIFIKK
jgi:hypothetical protein